MTENASNSRSRSRKASGGEGELTDKRWIVAGPVGWAAIIEDDRRIRLGLVLRLGWSSARAYSFLFYVLERYVGVEGRYAGLLDLIKRLRR